MSFTVTYQRLFAFLVAIALLAMGVLVWRREYGLNLTLTAKSASPGGYTPPNGTILEYPSPKLASAEYRARPQRLKSLRWAIKDFSDWYHDRQRNPKEYTLDLNKTVVDTMTGRLPTLLREFRNPCWLEYLPEDFSYQNSFFATKDCFRKDLLRRSFHSNMRLYQNRLHTGQHWRVRCFPYFFLLGVTKCGTTDLFHAMTTGLPDVIAGARKEAQFWNNRREGLMSRYSCSKATGAKASLHDYLDLYDEPAERMRQRVQTRNNSESFLITGDFTPATLWQMTKWRSLPGNVGLDAPQHTTAHLLHSLNPTTKYIISVRDPVKRAVSQYKTRCQGSKNCALSSDEFHRLVTGYATAFNSCVKVRGYRSCVYDYTLPSYSIVAPGFYYVFISDWMTVIPPNQFHVLRFEDYIANPLGTLRKIGAFLQTAPLRTQKRSSKIVNKNRKSLVPKPATLGVLKDLYRPWNERLAKLLKNDAFLWPG